MRIALAVLAVAALNAQTPPAARSPVLVELFTSEGCSDCPPADRLLAQLDPYVVVLSEHVDYWDQLGWRDPFSSHEFTVRQEEYAQRFHIEGPYTPQAVVDGLAEFVGSNAQRAKEEITRAEKRAKARVELSKTPAGVSVVVSDAPHSAGVFLALAQDTAASDVRAGENKGRHLAHVSVLQTLRKLGSVKSGAVFKTTAPLPNSSASLRVIVFLQDGASGPIFGAAELSPVR